MLNSIKHIINEYSYSINNKIGVGCSSEVYFGINQKNRKEVAIKIVSKLQHNKEKNTHIAETEIKCLQKLKDAKNVVQMLHAIRTRNNIYIISELCQKGTLYDMIKQKGRFSQLQSISCIKQIINGYRSIVKSNIIHRDIKPVNIFVTSKDQIKIGDFGLSIQLQQGQETVDGSAGSPSFMAPQVIAEKMHCFQSDIWSIGLTFLEMLLGTVPWKSRTELELTSQICSFNINNILPNMLSPKSKLFLRKTLTVDYNKRMKVQELLSFSFSDDKIASQKQQITDLQKDSKSKLINVLKCNLQASPKNKFQKTSNLSSNNFQLGQYKQEFNKQKHTDIRNKTQIQSKRLMQNLKDVKLKNQCKQTKNASDKSTSHQQKSFQKSIKHKQLESHSKYIQKNSQKQKFFAKDQMFASNLINPVKDQSINLKEKSLNLQKKRKRFIEIQDYSMNQNNQVQQKTIEKNGDNVKKTIKRSFTMQQAKVTPKMSEKDRVILIQLQSQINYFRFVYKIFKKVRSSLKTTDANILSFNKHMLYLVFQIIGQVRNFSFLKEASIIQIQNFKQSAHFQNLIGVLSQYQQRYLEQQRIEKIQRQFKGQKHFLTLLGNIVNILFQNVVSIENNSNELNRKKMLVFILQDLVKFGSIYLLSKQQNWLTFSKKSQLSKMIKQGTPDTINREYWQKVKAKILRLTQS